MARKASARASKVRRAWCVVCSRHQATKSARHHVENLTLAELQHIGRATQGTLDKFMTRTAPVTKEAALQFQRRVRAACHVFMLLAAGTYYWPFMCFGRLNAHGLFCPWIWP